MLLGDYYDEVVKEAKVIEEDSDVEAVKLAEAVEILATNKQTFETDEDAFKAASEIVENDYAEKVAAVCSEFDTDEIAFDNDEAKVASAVEIVDGWEKVALPNVKALGEKALAGAKSVAGKAKVVGGQAVAGAKTVPGKAKGAWGRLSTKKKIIAGAGAVGVTGAGVLGARKLLRSKKVEVQA